MRWSVFAIFAFVFLALELSLRNVLVLRSLANISPSFVAVLMVFVALFAPRSIALWAAWILGLLVDLCTDLAHGTDRVGPIIGPYALGYPFGAYLLVQVRAMLIRTRALTLSVMTILALLAVSIVVVFVYAVHGWYPNDQIAWADLRPAGELLRRIGVAVYTGLVALLIAPMLMWTIPAWSFRLVPQRGPSRR